MGSRFPLWPKTLSLHLDPGVTSLKSQEVSRDKSGSAFRRALEHSLLPLWKRPHQGQGQMAPLMVPSTQAGPPGLGGVFSDIWISSRMMDCKCRWPLVSEGHESSNPLSLLAGGLSLWMSSGSWEPSSPQPPYFLLGRHTVPTSLPPQFRPSGLLGELVMTATQCPQLTQAASRTCSHRRLAGMRKSRRKLSPSPRKSESSSRNTCPRTVGAVASKGG